MHHQINSVHANIIEGMWTSFSGLELPGKAAG